MAKCLHQQCISAGVAVRGSGKQRHLVLSLPSSRRHHAVPFTSNKASQRRLPHKLLTLTAAASTERADSKQNETAKSAQDIAEGVQSWLEDAQKQINSEPAPLPKHPVGEPGSLHISDGLDAEVSMQI